MKLKDVREWIDSLPEDFLEYNVVNAEEGEIDEEEKLKINRLDKPVITLDIDLNNKEALFLNKSS